MKPRFSSTRNQETTTYLHFLTYLEKNYSRSGVILSECYLRQIPLVFTKLKPPFLNTVKQLLDSHTSNKGIFPIFIVMSPAQLIAPLLRCFTRKPIILDAGWTLTESAIYRAKGKRFWLGVGVKNYLIDFFAMHMSSLVLLESEKQRRYARSRFLLPLRKSARVFTGFNEDLYSEIAFEKPMELIELKKFKKNSFIFFRGKYNSESGLERIAELTLKLESLNFVIASDINAEKFKFSKNTCLITRNLSEGEIKWLYVNSAICLGQLSKSKRLLNTIPHKAFEAGYFGKPYVSLSTGAVRELFPLNSQAIFVESNELDTLSTIISNMFHSPLELDAIGLECKSRYTTVASQSTLFHEFMAICGRFSPEN